MLPHLLILLLLPIVVTPAAVIVWYPVLAAGGLNPATQLAEMQSLWNGACTALSGAGELKNDGSGYFVCRCTGPPGDDRAISAKAQLDYNGHKGWKLGNP
ncbi:hypothetical protein IE81DRAFT_350534 [Ceraceosorus guamensis]|uniref:Uncharacterized protein n=1 Tax=Ceraceosorus guamensis TaxID=1522189 RepID=A0A316VS69_9BASI|nr:hypothetical protein IE81DRAFT_350534 [Ceraceosorus guamensis]PWN39031.1 hypothetical protein IE81DRAFT_350534 [Ceraceosorus guamensis]